MTYSELKALCKEGLDSYDPWGSVMEVFFSVAAELWMRPVIIPDAWSYCPSQTADPRDPDRVMYSVLLQAETSDLLKLGHVLNRYVDLLILAGKNY